tara:strand:+ start:155 stop:361 length:207 start_codon:yes stop_codon:yes gene_type:complete
MLKEPRYYTRQCVHYRGVIWLGKEESSEVNSCNAFPDGIPDEIAYGDNLHLKPLKGQGNDIVFEKEEV